MVLESKVRKHFAQLLGVEPFRLEVEIHPSFEAFRVLLDGQDPTDDQMRIIEQDIEDTTKSAKAKMN